MASLLRSAGLRVRYAGPGEKLPLTHATLAAAALYAQPGGADDLDAAVASLEPHRRTIVDYVRGGGRYLGFCMGAYLAGSDPGLDLLPGAVDQYIASRGADVATEDDTVVAVQWRGKRRRIFFQDGPYFRLGKERPELVLARYAANDAVAALVTPCGKGKVGVVGPHPEATEDWFEDAGLRLPRRLAHDLGYDLLATLLR